MSHWYIQIGVDMNSEALSQVKQDLEHLTADIQKLISDLGDASKEEALELKEAGLSSVNKVLEQVNLSKEKLAQTSDYFLCKTKCTLHEKPLLSLSVVAVIGMAIGAMIARK
jgi:ElaB/YqjD/DUF883 family membrane-anchored ribosome-binding protein